MRGPPPTPTKILKLRNSWRAKSRAKTEPAVAEVSSPNCPDWLPAAAKAVWRSVVRLLSPLGVLLESDRQVLARYCCLWVRWRRAEESLAEGSVDEVVKGDGATVRRLKPEVAEAASLASELRMLEDRMALSPSARSRVKSEPAEAEDPFEGYLAKRSS